MVTIFFLESVVHFDDYSRYILSHTGRLEKEIKEIRFEFIKVIAENTSTSDHVKS
jgi:hypothetical protein